MCFLGCPNKSSRYAPQPVDEVNWPKSLKQLTFGRNFNQPIHDVIFPVSLVRLDLGDSFNKAIAGVTWPESLEQITFGQAFSQDIDSSKWPPRLKKLAFGGSFNRCVDLVQWPPMLTELTFGREFNQVNERRLFYEKVRGRDMQEEGMEISTFVSGTLKKIIHCIFRSNRFVSAPLFFLEWQPVDKVTWPTGLTKLAFGHRFDPESLNGLVWPESLKEVHVGRISRPISDGRRLHPWRGWDAEE